MNCAGPITARVEQVPLRRVWTGAQADDWLAGREPLREFYGHRPTRESLPAALAARAAQSRRADPGAVAAALRESLTPFGITAAMDAALLRLARAETFVVVTGQQPGLLGGPLYTIYKALAAIAEAARLNQSGTPAVPVFWVASEDDDYAEIQRAWVLDRDGQPRELAFRIPHREGQSVGAMTVPAAEATRLRDELAAALPATAFRDAIVESFLAGSADRTISEGFTAWLLAQLGEAGLLVLDPMQPAIRRLGAPLLAEVLADPLRPTRLAEEVGERLARLGYPIPTHRAPNLCGFYLYREGRRERLWYADGRYATADGTRLEPAELARILANDPARFSTGLLLRPVLQDYLLRTAAFIVGPGEAAYAAQVMPNYDAHQIARPLLLPRFSATIVEPKVGRYLAAYGLDPLAVRDDFEALLSRTAREAVGSPTAALFGTVAEELAEPLAKLRAHASGVDATLSAAADGMSRRVQRELDRLETKVQRALKQADETLRRRVATVHGQLAPGGAPQERRLALASYEARYGPPLLTRLGEIAATCEPGCHALVRIER